ncbi:MAG: hypothetical protein MK171_10205 [Pirellulales bacterium]|nr:hypothetical protein [Pirellulales bacterium]
MRPILPRASGMVLVFAVGSGLLADPASPESGIHIQRRDSGVRSDGSLLLWQLQEL